MQARIVYRSRCYRGDMNLPGRHSPPRSDTFIKTECTEIHHQHHIGQLYWTSIAVTRHCVIDAGSTASTQYDAEKTTQKIILI